MLTDEDIDRISSRFNAYPFSDATKRAFARAVIEEVGAQLLEEVAGICEEEAELAWLRSGDGTGAASAKHCAEEIRKLRKRLK